MCGGDEHGSGEHAQGSDRHDSRVDVRERATQTRYRIVYAEQ